MGTSTEAWKQGPDCTATREGSGAHPDFGQVMDGELICVMLVGHGAVGHHCPWLCGTAHPGHPAGLNKMHWHLGASLQLGWAMWMCRCPSGRRRRGSDREAPCRSVIGI